MFFNVESFIKLLFQTILKSAFVVWKFFTMVTYVQMVPIFPPKDLEKIRALKIRMRRFF